MKISTQILMPVAMLVVSLLLMAGIIYEKGSSITLMQILAVLGFCLVFIWISGVILHHVLVVDAVQRQFRAWQRENENEKI